MGAAEVSVHVVFEVLFLGNLMKGVGGIRWRAVARQRVRDDASMMR